MDIYRSYWCRIRNVVLLGHGGAGKTTLTEAMAYISGITSRLGKVSEGNTVSDFDKEEYQAWVFNFDNPLSADRMATDGKINILDTPGFFDFVGEAEEAVAAADAAIIVVNGKSRRTRSVRQKAWELCEKYNLPRMIFCDRVWISTMSASVRR